MLLLEGDPGQADAGRAGDCLDSVVGKRMRLLPQAASLITPLQDTPAFHVVVHLAADGAGVAALDGELCLGLVHKLEPLHEQVKLQ